jgi:hypothetical protein
MPTMWPSEISSLYAGPFLTGDLGKWAYYFRTVTHAEGIAADHPNCDYLSGVRLGSRAGDLRYPN